MNIQNEFINDIEIITDSIKYRIIKQYKESLLFAIYCNSSYSKNKHFYNLIELFINTLPNDEFLLIKDFLYINGNINADKLDILIDIFEEEFQEYMED